MKLFAKQTGLVKPNETSISTRGAKVEPAKGTGVVKPSGTNTSTKGTKK